MSNDEDVMFQRREDGSYNALKKFTKYENIFFDDHYSPVLKEFAISADKFKQRDLRVFLKRYFELRRQFERYDLRYRTIHEEYDRMRRSIEIFPNFRKARKMEKLNDLKISVDAALAFSQESLNKLNKFIEEHLTIANYISMSILHLSSFFQKDFILRFIDDNYEKYLKFLEIKDDVIISRMISGSFYSLSLEDYYYSRESYQDFLAFLDKYSDK